MLLMLLFDRSDWVGVCYNVVGSSDGNLCFLKTFLSSITVEGSGWQVSGLAVGFDAINQFLRLVVCFDVAAVALSNNQNRIPDVR